MKIYDPNVWLLLAMVLRKTGFNVSQDEIRGENGSGIPIGNRIRVV
jgi:hypothetical protein